MLDDKHSDILSSCNIGDLTFLIPNQRVDGLVHQSALHEESDVGFADCRVDFQDEINKFWTFMENHNIDPYEEFKGSKFGWGVIKYYC